MQYYDIFHYQLLYNLSFFLSIGMSMSSNLMWHWYAKVTHYKSAIALQSIFLPIKCANPFVRLLD